MLNIILGGYFCGLGVMVVIFFLWLLIYAGLNIRPLWDWLEAPWERLEETCPVGLRDKLSDFRELLRERCYGYFCGKLLWPAGYLLRLVIGPILLGFIVLLGPMFLYLIVLLGAISLILIVLVAVVATAILISISWPISPLLLPIYLFKWLINKVRRKKTDLELGGSIVP
jgi:hypothetical protein